jgi:simple sugar transport system permease protein
LNGIGFTLVRATPLIFIGLGTIFAWTSGFNYLGFEGTLYIGGAMAAWLALLCAEDGAIGPLPPLLFFPLVFVATFVAGGLWSGVVGWLRARFGGNEVLISLMMNYLAVFLINYLVSGPLRAPGDLPQTARLPAWTTLPFILPGTRAHAGILVALLAAVVVWLVLRRTPIGYELIVAGFSPKAAHYSGINVANRIVLAAFVAGGLGAMAGLSEVLGVQFRLLDGISRGTGFVGIVAALLGRLNPFGVVVASILYAGMGVGADAMQRRAGLPSSVIFIIQSLIVLLIIASDLLRYYKINWKRA